ncbi:MAG: hypothetical protein WD534_06910 [Phycisphaeraceae bacterium]
MTQPLETYPPFDLRQHRLPLPEGQWRTTMWLRPNPDLRAYDDRLEYALTIDGYTYARQ